MPAQIVPSFAGILAKQYSIIARYATSSDPVKFVVHLSVLREDDRVSYGREVKVWEMGPPLVLGTATRMNTAKDPKCIAHLLAWVEFNQREKEAITDWLAEIDQQCASIHRLAHCKQYTASLEPEDQWMEDERGIKQIRRFNCVSFVLAAYQEGAGVQILGADSNAELPPVSLEVVSGVYGDRLRTHEQLRTMINLSGNGPWRVLLPGYVLHALNRTDKEIRSNVHFVVDSQEQYFPIPKG